MLHIQTINQPLKYHMVQEITVPDTVNIILHFYIESTDLKRSIFNKVGRVLAKQKVLISGSNKIEAVSN